MAKQDPQLIVTPRGVLAFNGWGNPDYMRIMQLDGAEAPALRRDIFPLSGRSGGSVGDAFDDPLYPAFTGDIVSNTAPIFVTRRVLADRLKSYLRSTMRVDGLWKWLPAGANLIQNGDFETDTSGWTAYGTATLTSDATQSFYHSKSLKVVTTAATGGASASPVARQLVPGATYTTAFVAKRTVGTGALHIRTNFFDASSAFLSYAQTDFTPTGSWAYYSHTFVAPPTADSNDMDIFCDNGSAQTLYVDTVKTEYGNAASAYSGPGDAGWSSMRQRACRVYLNAIVTPGQRLDSFNFALACADPIAYSEFLRTSPDITFGGAAVSVVNSGDEPTWPTIQITGGITNPTITNVLTGEAIVFNGLVVAGGAVVNIDTRLGRVSLVSDGSSKLSGEDIANTKVWPLYAGAQTVSCTGSSPSGSPKVNLIYRDAWGG